MLSAVLHSPAAVNVSVRIIQAFVAIRICASCECFVGSVQNTFLCPRHVYVISSPCAFGNILDILPKIPYL